MDWVPVTTEQFESISSEEPSTLALDVLRLYRQHTVQPFHFPCLRNQESGIEQVFVLAKKGNRLLYFDDVEEDFGVATADDDGVMRKWGNDGPFVRALLVLDEGQPVG